MTSQQAPGSLAARPAIQLVLLLLLIAVAYSNSVFSPPVLDDYHSFIDIGQMHPPDFSWNSLSKIANTTFGIARFIPLLTFAINNNLTPGNYLYYHLTNIFIHLLAVATLFFFLLGLFKRTSLKECRSFLPRTLMVLGICGLWGLSPVQTNVVTYLVQRMASLMALFYLLAMTFYLYGRTSESGISRFTLLILCAVSAALAFMSKENSATLPLAILLLEFTFISPGSFTRLLASLRPRHWLAIGLILLLVLPLPLRFLSDTINGYSHRPFNCLERLLTESRVVVWYLSLLALPLPSRMNFDHETVISTSLFSPPTTILSLIFLGLLIATTFKFRHHSPLVTFGVFFFFLNLLIESTIVPLELVFEHRLYLPSVGFFMALAGIIDLTLRRFKGRTGGALQDSRPIWLGLIIILAASSLLTSLRNNDWRDAMSLYGDVISKSPGKPRAYANLGLALGKAGRCREAIPLLEKAISLGTRYDETYLTSANNLTICVQKTAGSAEAAARMEELMRHIPPQVNQIALPDFLSNQGKIYWQLGNYRMALEKFRESLESDDQANNGYMLMDIAALIREVYNVTGDGGAIGLAGFSDPATATTFTLAKMLLDSRDYRSAAQLLSEIDPNSSTPEMAPLVELKKRLADEQERNRCVAEATDISRDDFFSGNRKNLIFLKFSRLITNHYPPLYFLADLMLSDLRERNPDDPFVAGAIIRLQSARKPRTYDLVSLRKNIAANPCFAPLLEIETRQLIALNRKDAALSSADKLLQVYPGTPNWQYWQHYIRQQKESSMHGDGK